MLLKIHNIYSLVPQSAFYVQHQKRLEAYFIMYIVRDETKNTVFFGRIFMIFILY